MHLPLRIPKVQLCILLLLIFFSTFSQYLVFSSIDIFSLSVGFTIFFDLLFTFIRRKRLFVPYAALATGLIIALIIDPEALWYQVAVVSAIAMGSKNFLRISGKHIFNPAAIGLFIGGIVFQMYASWWGVSFQNLREFTFHNLVLFLILLLPVFVSAYRMRRIYSILTFLIANILFSHIFTFNFSLQSILDRLLDPTTIFFATVMLPEPMTSPVNTKRQVLFGVTVACILLVLSYPEASNLLINAGVLPDLFIPALLLGNILFFKFR